MFQLNIMVYWYWRLMGYLQSQEPQIYFCIQIILLPFFLIGFFLQWFLFLCFCLMISPLSKHFVVHAPLVDSSVCYMLQIGCFFLPLSHFVWLSKLVVSLVVESFFLHLCPTLLHVLQYNGFHSYSTFWRTLFPLGYLMFM